MIIKELLVERVVNLFRAEDKPKYAQQVWDLLQLSYQKAGGFKSADDIDDLINKSNMWKLVVRAGKVTAAGIYKDQHGRKTIAAGTDGTVQGKRDYMMIKDADFRFERSWAEVSGAPEKLMARAGMEPIPAKLAPLLTGKEILDYNEDGYHYTRLIAGEPHEKVIYGSVKLSADTMATLQKAGIQLHELPKSFKKSG